MFRVRYGLMLLAACVLCVACSKSTQPPWQGYIEGRYTYIASTTAGYLNILSVDRGDTVKANQLLYSLDQMPELAQLEQAKHDLKAAQDNLKNLELGQRSTVLASIDAQLKQAKASLTFAQQTLQRDQELYQKKAIGKARLDQSTSDFNNAKQKVKQVEADLAEAKLGARFYLIQQQQAVVDAAKSKVDQLSWTLQQKEGMAPVDARVYDTFYRKGEYVQAGQPVLSLLAPDNVKLIFFVPEPQLSQLHVKQTIYFNCDGCKQHQSATVRFISHQAEYTPPVIYSQDSRNKLVYRVEASLSPEVAMKVNPGQPVDVYLTAGPTA